MYTSISHLQSAHHWQMVKSQENFPDPQDPSAVLSFLFESDVTEGYRKTNSS